MDVLPGRYFTLPDMLFNLLLVVCAGVVLCWWLRRRSQQSHRPLEQRLTGERAEHENEQRQALQDQMQSAVAHEFVKGLDYISKKSEETLAGLGEDETLLRDKQERIIDKASELTQHAVNILDVFAPAPAGLARELLSIRRLVEGVLLELYPYAESKGVTLRPRLDDIEPTPLNRNLTSLALNNLIHNAIKYSQRGGVVEVDLALQQCAGHEAEKAICIEVKDTGKGIREENQPTLFELKKRGDGLIEPGSGLGLFCARRAARRQGGDVTLVKSSLNNGSIFRATFPYTGIVAIRPGRDAEPDGRGAL